MTDKTPVQIPFYTPFVFLVANSFFSAAREGLDPVLQTIDAYETIDSTDQTKAEMLDTVSQKFKSIPYIDQLQVIGMCVRATTNLGLAYTHFIRLLMLLETGKELLQNREHSCFPHLVELFDALPASTQQQLDEVYRTVGTHDFFITANIDSPSPATRDKVEEKSNDFRQQLLEWQEGHLLQESHLLFASSAEQGYRILVPVQSMFLLDRVIGRLVAPRMNIKYQEMDGSMSSRVGDPIVDWNGENIFITLPDKLGKKLHAEWEPDEIYIVRIREKGTDDWSLGFRTPFTKCSFAGLKPDTEYEAHITLKNKSGESDSQIVPFWPDAHETEVIDA